MEWDKKMTMASLGNQRYDSDKAKKKFQDFVVENIDSFDDQSWEIFCNFVDLIIEEMKKDIEFWKQVYVKIKEFNGYVNRFGIRSGMRIAMIQTICEDNLSLS
jgi:hypothetical protein